MNNLYVIDDLGSVEAQMIEERFFKPTDSHAADALSLLEAGTTEWDARRRSGWSRFLYSLELRCPEDVDLFRAEWKAMLEADPKGEWEERYQRARQKDDPPTYNAYVRSIAAADLSISTMHALASLIDSVTAGEKLNGLSWHVIRTDAAEHELLTSDRPIIRTNGLLTKGGHLAMPIGPRSLFVAVHEPETIKRLRAIPRKDLVAEVNRKVAEQAVSFVYGRSDAALAFVQKWMSTNIGERLVETAVRNRLALQETILEMTRQKPAGLADSAQTEI